MCPPRRFCVTKNSSNFKHNLCHKPVVNKKRLKIGRQKITGETLTTVMSGRKGCSKSYASINFSFTKCEKRKICPIVKYLQHYFFLVCFVDCYFAGTEWDEKKQSETKNNAKDFCESDKKKKTKMV